MSARSPCVDFFGLMRLVLPLYIPFSRASHFSSANTKVGDNNIIYAHKHPVPVVPFPTIFCYLHDYPERCLASYTLIWEGFLFRQPKAKVSQAALPKPLEDSSSSGPTLFPFSCDFKDLCAEKRPVVNQKGYGVGEKFDFDRSKLVSIAGKIPTSEAKTVSTFSLTARRLLDTNSLRQT